MNKSFNQALKIIPEKRQSICKLWVTAQFHFPPIHQFMRIHVPQRCPCAYLLLDSYHTQASISSIRQFPSKCLVEHINQPPLFLKQSIIKEIALSLVCLLHQARLGKVIFETSSLTGLRLRRIRFLSVKISVKNIKKLPSPHF